MCNYFRTLRADEIEVRVQQVKKSSKGNVYARLLLYKDARVDMMLLDEMFGIFGWQREHVFRDGKNYCRVSVFNEKRNEWVVKEDVGIPSNTEAEKGQASDAFKRACVNLGLGRELYSAPLLSVLLGENEYYQDGKDKNGEPKYKLAAGIYFSVNAIAYDSRRNIISIRIIDSRGDTRIEKGDLHDALFMAIEEANGAKTPHEVKNVWRKYPEFQEDTRFICACNEGGEDLIK